MEDPPPPARAALALVCLLGLLARPPAPPPGPVCARPAALVAGHGWTRTVACRDGAGPLRGPARLLFGQGLDPNRADAAALEVLPGIGPARARALVEARETAPFCRVGDLERVRGIGPRTRQGLEVWIAIAPSPECSPTDAPGRDEG